MAAREAEASWKMCKFEGLQMFGSSMGTGMSVLEIAHESALSVPAQSRPQPKLLILLLTVNSIKLYDFISPQGNFLAQ